MKLGTEQAQKITKLETENNELKKQLAAKPTPTPTPGPTPTTGGSPTDPQPIAGSEE